MNLDSSSPEMRIWFVVRTLVYENLQCLFVNNFIFWFISDGRHMVQMCLNIRIRILKVIVLHAVAKNKLLLPSMNAFERCS